MQSYLHVVGAKSIHSCDISGYNPQWNDELKFRICVTDLAIINFTVTESNNTILGQYTLPYRCLKQGLIRMQMLINVNATSKSRK